MGAARLQTWYFTRSDAPERRLLLTAIVCARQAHHRTSRPPIHGQIGQDARISGCSIRRRRMRSGACNDGPLARAPGASWRRADHAIEPRVVHHLQDDADPRPSSPRRRAQARSNSTSLEALLRFPSLSLSRWRWKPLRSRQASSGGRRKQESPRGACASTRNASLIGAEQNHLCP